MLEVPIEVLLVEQNPGEVWFIRQLLGENEAANEVATGLYFSALVCGKEEGIAYAAGPRVGKPGNQFLKLLLADSLTAAFNHLERNRIQLLLLDLRLPDSKGLETLSRVRARWPEVPVVVLIGEDEESLGVRAVRHGAQDYLVKRRLSAEILARCIRHSLELHRAVAQLHRLEKAFSEESARRRLLFEDWPDGIVVIDLQTMRILEFNSAACRQLGYSREEFATLRLPDIVANKDAEKIRTTIEEVTRQGRADIKVLHRFKRGEILSMRIIA
jgi:PAS domain S-box-containing protein